MVGYFDPTPLLAPSFVSLNKLVHEENLKMEGENASLRQESIQQSILNFLTRHKSRLQNDELMKTFLRKLNSIVIHSFIQSPSLLNCLFNQAFITETTTPHYQKTFRSQPIRPCSNSKNFENFPNLFGSSEISNDLPIMWTNLH